MISNGRKDIIGKHRKYDGTTHLITSMGSTPVQTVTDVSVPELVDVGKTEAIISRLSPNLIPLGRLVMEHLYSVHWDHQRGFRLKDRRGKLVNTHLDSQLLPRLGDQPTPSFSSTATVADVSCTIQETTWLLLGSSGVSW